MSLAGGIVLIGVEKGTSRFKSLRGRPSCVALWLACLPEVGRHPSADDRYGKGRAGRPCHTPSMAERRAGRKPILGCFRCSGPASPCRGVEVGFGAERGRVFAPTSVVVPPPRLGKCDGFTTAAPAASFSHELCENWSLRHYMLRIDGNRVNIVRTKNPPDKHKI